MRWDNYRRIMEAYDRKPDLSGRPVWGAAMVSALFALAPFFLAASYEWPLRTGNGWRYICVGVMMPVAICLALLYDRMGGMPKPKPWIEIYAYLVTALVLHVSVAGALIVAMVLDGAPERAARASWILLGAAVAMTGSSFAVLLRDYVRQRRRAGGKPA